MSLSDRFKLNDILSRNYDYTLFKIVFREYDIWYDHICLYILCDRYVHLITTIVSKDVSTKNCFIGYSSQLELSDVLLEYFCPSVFISWVKLNFEPPNWWRMLTFRFCLCTFEDLYNASVNMLDQTQPFLTHDYRCLSRLLGLQYPECRLILNL